MDRTLGAVGGVNRRGRTWRSLLRVPPRHPRLVCSERDRMSREQSGHAGAPEGSVARVGRAIRDDMAAERAVALGGGDAASETSQARSCGPSSQPARAHFPTPPSTEATQRQGTTRTRARHGPGSGLCSTAGPGPSGLHVRPVGVLAGLGGSPDAPPYVPPTHGGQKASFSLRPHPVLVRGPSPQPSAGSEPHLRPRPGAGAPARLTVSEPHALRCPGPPQSTPAPVCARCCAALLPGHCPAPSRVCLGPRRMRAGSARPVGHAPRPARHPLPTFSR